MRAGFWSPTPGCIKQVRIEKSIDFVEERPHRMNENTQRVSLCEIALFLLSVDVHACRFVVPRSGEEGAYRMNENTQRISLCEFVFFLLSVDVHARKFMVSHSGLPEAVKN